MDENINKEEFKVAEDDAKSNGFDHYTHKFRKPFNWMGSEIKTLDFDFGKLTGKDGRAIESELASLGKAVITPALSGEYLVRLASKASGLGDDAFDAMPLPEYTSIISRARSFLLKSEL